MDPATPSDAERERLERVKRTVRLLQSIEAKVDDFSARLARVETTLLTLGLMVKRAANEVKEGSG